MEENSSLGWLMAPSAFDRAQIFLVCQTERTVEMAAWDNWSGPWRPTQPSLICWGGKNVSHGLKIREQKKNQCCLVEALMMIWKERMGRCAKTHVWPLISLSFHSSVIVVFLPFINTSFYGHVFCAVYFTLVTAQPFLALLEMVQAEVHFGVF